jgi:hypothetical protein
MSIVALRREGSVVAAWALALIAGYIGFISSDAALAQTRPALIKNIDEPGRNPYQAFVTFSLTTPSTDNSYFCQQPPDPPVCFLLYPSVPIGRRLVIENVTGRIDVRAPGFPLAINIQASDPNFRNIVNIPFQLLPGDLGGGVLQYGANATLKNYVEAGTVRIQISVLGAPGDLRFGQISMSGYTVDIP